MKIRDIVATDEAVSWYRNIVEKYYLKTPAIKRTDEIMKIVTYGLRKRKAKKKGSK